MQKFVKFRFTLSALSAMEYIFGLHSDLRRRSVIINGVHFWSDCKGLNMKTYTLTWRHATYYGSTLSRCRFDGGSYYWNHLLDFDPVVQFCWLTSVHSFVFNKTSFRLSRCGKLVARSATYQGV